MVAINNKEILFNNFDKIHTTKMGIDRIKKNTGLDIAVLLKEIKKDNCKIERKGKNFYITNNDYIVTINAYTYTIITAHRMK